MVRLRALLALLALAAPVATTGAALAQPAPTGSIRGAVYDRDFGSPVPQVRVTVLETQQSALSNGEGMFAIDRLPSGVYTLSLSKDGYERLLVQQVTVIAGRISEVRAEIGSEIVELEELVVMGVDLLSVADVGVLELRAAAVQVQDAISADLISKAGLSDVAGALKLVVGASVTEGKYATVRGLSDRYTGTTLNGLRVPSADPRRRAVQIDLFPTGTIDSVTVTKTFTPDLQAEFTGGGVNIKTRSIPDKPMAAASVSAEYDDFVTGNGDFLTYDGGGVDPTGFDVADRALPDEAKAPLPPFPDFPQQPTEEDIAASEAYDQLVRSFDPTIGVRNGTPGPNYSFSVVGGDRFDLGRGVVAGLVGALTYSHKYDFYEDGQNNTVGVTDPTQPILVTRDRTDSRSVDDLLIGGLATGEIRWSDDHHVAVNVVGNQSAEDEARFQEHNPQAEFTEQNQSLRYTERSLLSTQVHGDHVFEGALGPEGSRVRDLHFDWIVATSLTRQIEPDVRFFRNWFDSASMIAFKPGYATNDSQITRRIWRGIEENNNQFGANVEIPFLQWSNRSALLKFGASLDRSSREFDQDSFYYYFPAQPGRTPSGFTAVRYNRSLSGYQASSPHDLWTDVFLDPERIGLAGNRCTPPDSPLNRPPQDCAVANQLLWVILPTLQDVNYDGEQSITAAYAMIDLPIISRLNFIGGARQERSSISVAPFSPATGTVEIVVIANEEGDRGLVRVPQEEAAGLLDDRSWAPALGLVYEVLPQMKLRAAWSRTLARPNFRELAPVATEEYLAGDEFVGNPDLVISKITNYDLRWEWFRKPGEVLAASVFYKKILDPIEFINFSAGARILVQPINYDVGEVRGAEVEARLPLELYLGWLRWLTFNVNYSYIDSQVEVPESEQDSLAPFGLDQETRRLQGQPAFLLNASLTYDNEASGTSLNLFYNHVGEMLLTGAARGESDGIPDVFEQPYQSLDFTASQKLSAALTISMKVRNLLKPDRQSLFRTPDGKEEVKFQRSTASQYAVGLSYRW